MGIIKAVLSAAGGALADQWLEVIEPDDMGEHTVFTRGIMVRPRDKRGQNNKGTQALITNGSVVHVYPNQFMMLVDGGKVVDRRRILSGGEYRCSFVIQWTVR